MANASVTVKMTPDEHRTLCAALEAAKLLYIERAAASTGGDRHSWRSDAAKVVDLLARL